MIRFIIKTDWRHLSGAQGEGFSTLDIDVPELEQALSRGGFGEDAFEFSSLVGAEILPAKDQTK